MKIPNVLKKRKLWIILASSIAAVTTSNYITFRESNDYVVPDFPRSFSTSIYRIFPTQSLSRLTGKIMSIEIPDGIKYPILQGYVKLTGCNMSEADPDDISQYKSLSQLFTRQLKPSARSIDYNSKLISPCDGTVMYFGKIDPETETMEQVKGTRFTVKGFTGGDEFFNKKQVFYCIIYLSPGDMHHFYSPIEWKVDYRRYFPGTLMSVNPFIAKHIPGLFSVNERVVYFGDWEYGKFAMAAIGATNVGNMFVHFDDDLPTNYSNQYYPKKRKLGEIIPSPTQYRPEIWFKKFDNDEILLKKGDKFGFFNFGSTIVLIFEIPENQKFTFNLFEGQKLKMGTQIGKLDNNGT